MLPQRIVLISLMVLCGAHILGMSQDKKKGLVLYSDGLPLLCEDPQSIRALRATASNPYWIGQALALFTHLEKLWLEEQNLEQWPDALNSLRLLESLYLCGNSLTSLPSGPLNNLRKLKELDLEGNRLEQIEPGALNDLGSLEVLGLKNNKLKELNVGSLARLKELKYLVLDGNQLTTISEGTFNNNTKLRELFLGNNNLTALQGKVFRSNPDLKILGLWGNKLKTLPTGLFHDHSKLEMLDLGHNNFTKIPHDALAGLVFLKWFSVKDNQIRDPSLISLSNFACLEKFNIAENRLSPWQVAEIKSYFGLQNIQRLFQRRSNIVANISNQGINQPSMNIAINGSEDNSNERARLLGGAQVVMGLSELHRTRSSRR